MKCHFCDETLKEGELICHNCKSMVIDFNYMKNLREIENKYSKRDFLELSKEKLTFQEIVTILTSLKGQTVMLAIHTCKINVEKREHTPTCTKD